MTWKRTTTSETNSAAALTESSRRARTNSPSRRGPSRLSKRKRSRIWLSSELKLRFSKLWTTQMSLKCTSTLRTKSPFILSWRNATAESCSTESLRRSSSLKKRQLLYSNKYSWPSTTDITAGSVIETLNQRTSFSYLKITTRISRLLTSDFRKYLIRQCKGIRLWKQDEGHLIILVPKFWRTTTVTCEICGRPDEFST